MAQLRIGQSASQARGIGRKTGLDFTKQATNPPMPDKKQRQSSRAYIINNEILSNQNIQLMRINQFAEERENRNFLPKLLRSQSGASAGKHASPFSMPEDAEIFRMKEKERQRKREEKAQKQKMKIWEKGVKKHGITIKELNDLGRHEQDEEQNQAKMSLIEAAKNAIKNRVKINEPMHEFISKKRETLLFQMLIDHKRQKINEFEEMTRLHRKGLERAEKMLEEDMDAFNSYLNENKKQARDAIKKAELQTREKNEKVAVIKEKLEIQADLTGKNMSKRETLQNLRKYKLFLDSLNPNISKEERDRIHERIQKEQQQAQNFGGMNMSQNLSDSDEEENLDFKDAEQLMDVFHSLEESNLSLITHLKEMEQQIEEAKGLYNNKKEVLFKKKNQLLTNKEQILRQIQQVQSDIDDLKKTTNKDEVTIYYNELENEIIRLAKEIEFVSANQKHLSALVLLKDIELNIEKQLEFLKTTKEEKPALIQTLEKQCITRKRERKREKNEEQMEEKAMKQKSEAEPERQKRKGRPIMARSVIKREKRKKEVEVVEPQEEIEKRKYLLPD